MKKLKPFDIVLVYSEKHQNNTGSIGMVTETDGEEASIE